MREYELGTWAEIPTPYATHIMMKAGFDFAIVDMEHGIIEYELAQNMVFTAHSVNKKIYIRVPAIEEPWILRALDTGCDGIVFPQVARAEDVKRIVQYSYFSPIGDRGFNPYIAAGNYHNVSKKYFKEENDRIKIAVILEGKEAFEQIDEILSFPQIDVIYIGQYDLSVALGIPGEIENPILLKIMDEIVQKSLAVDKKVGCMVHSASEAKKIISKGFQFVVYKVDTGILYDAVNGFVQDVKG